MKKKLKYQHKFITELKWSIDKSWFIFYKEPVQKTATRVEEEIYN